MSAEDHRYMSQALRLAAKGVYSTDPNPRVGCVIVKQGRIIGEGWHQKAGGPHAEINALRKAGSDAKGSTAYVTLEPCSHHGKTPPCADALIKAGVTRVVAGMQDPNPLVSGEGLRKLAAAGLQVQSGVMQPQAEALNPGFIKRMRHNRPYVRCKLAMSVDGRTALANGESRWITGPEARRDVHRLRARSSAILTGINTVLADDPSLNARLENTATSGEDTNCEILQPLRVVVDSGLRMPIRAKMLSLEGTTMIATVNNDVSKISQLQHSGAQVDVLPSRDGRVDLDSLMEHLAGRQINELMVEAGSVLNGALLQQNLVDEFIIYMAPCLLGDNAKGLFSLPGLRSMDDRMELVIKDIRAVGNDWRISAHVRS